MLFHSALVVSFLCRLLRRRLIFHTPAAVASMRHLSQLTCSHAATHLNSPRKNVSLGHPQLENISSQCPDHCSSDVALALLLSCSTCSLRAAFGVCVLFSELIDRQRLRSKKRWYSIELMPPGLKSTACFLIAMPPPIKNIRINFPRESSAREARA